MLQGRRCDEPFWPSLPNSLKNARCTKRCQIRAHGAPDTGYEHLSVRAELSESIIPLDIPGRMPTYHERGNKIDYAMAILDGEDILNQANLTRVIRAY